MKTVSIHLIRVAVFIVLATGLLVIAGWQFDQVLLKQFLPGSVAMNPMSAFSFLLCSLSFILLLAKEKTKLRLTIASALLLLVLLIALLKLAAFMHLFDVGIDRLFFPGKIVQPHFQGAPNSMAPNTAVGFLLTGTALFFYRMQKISAYQWLSLCTALLSLLSLIGYAYRVDVFYGMHSFIPMALNTAGCFFLLSMAILFAQSDKGFIEEITSPYAGGHAARLLLPVAILFPFLIGLFIFHGSAVGLYSFSFATAVLVTAIIFIFIFLIWLTASAINKVEHERTLERQKANDELKQASAHVFDLYNNAPCGYHSLDINGFFTDINDTELNWLGYKREELTGILRFQDLLTPDSKIQFAQIFPSILKTGSAKDKLYEMIRKNGTSLTVMISAIAIIDQEGNFLRTSATIIDYTEQKKKDDQIKQFNLDLEKQVVEKTKQVIEKEQQFRFLIENMKEGIQLIGYDWKYLLINKSAIEHAGFSSAEELLGYTLMEKNPGIIHSAFYRFLEKCMKNRVPEIFITDVDSPDGTTGWLNVSMQPVPEGVLILSMDITEQKKAEEEIRRSQQDYYSLMNNVDGIVWEADAITFNFSFVSKQAERLLGYPIEQWLTEPAFWENHIYEEDQDWAINYCQQSTQQKKAHEFEYRMVAADGRIIWFRDIVSVEAENNMPVKLRGIMVDITERKKMEDALAESENRLRTIFNTEPECVKLLDINGGLLDMNPAGLAMIEADSLALVKGTSTINIVSAAYKEKYQQLISSVFNGQTGKLEFEITGLKGTRRWMETHAVPLRNADGIITSLLGVSRDVTERNQSEEKLRESNKRYQFVNKATQDIIWEWDFASGEGLWGENLVSTFGYAAEDLHFKENGLHQFVHPEDRERVMNNFIYHIENNLENLQDEYRFKCADGTYKDVLNRSFLLLDENKRPYKIIGALSDLTEKKKLEKELADKRLVQQKLITEITIRAQEKERNELGRELHDNISQMLAVVKLYLGMLKNGQDPEGTLLIKSYNHLDNTIEEIRKLSHSLTPPSLGETGLKTALQTLVDNTALSPGIVIELKVDKKYQSAVTDKNKELMLYRIVQEQLNNTIKHAQASKISVSLKCNDDNLYLSVSDNGVGFDPSQTSKGIGLQNINSRVEFYSGKMHINSAPGKGCSLEVCIPY